MTVARPISAPYSSCSRRRDSSDPSKPEKLASTTTGLLPLAALMARATFLDDLVIRRIATGERPPMTSAKGNVANAACSVAADELEIQGDHKEKPKKAREIAEAAENRAFRKKRTSSSGL